MPTPGDDAIAVLHCVGRVWAVAAIHGEHRRLSDLHTALWARLAPRDRLVYLGNYLGHGAQIPETLDELIAFRTAVLCRAGMEPEDIVFLRGTQEEMWRKLLQLQFAATPLDVYEWMMPRGVAATLKAYGGVASEGAGRCRGGPLALTRWTNGLREAMRQHPGHEELMIALRRAAVTEGQELLFVHAGIDPARPLAAQGDAFWWGSSRFANLAAPYEGFRRVVAGFSSGHVPLLDAPHLTVLDAGCGFHGPLTAACFTPDGRMVDRIEA